MVVQGIGYGRGEERVSNRREEDEKRAWVMGKGREDWQKGVGSYWHLRNSR